MSDARKADLKVAILTRDAASDAAKRKARIATEALAAGGASVSTGTPANTVFGVPIAAIVIGAVVLVVAVVIARRV